MLFGAARLLKPGTMVISQPAAAGRVPRRTRKGRTASSTQAAILAQIQIGQRLTSAGVSL